MPRNPANPRKPPKQTRKQKQGNKNPRLREHALLARIKRDTAELAALRSGNETPAKQKAARTETPRTEVTITREEEGDRRVVIKFFYNYLGQPPEEDWGGKGGAIAAIRRFMGENAPWPATVRRMLERLQDA